VNRREFLEFTGLFGATLALPGAAPPLGGKKKRPNFIFIVADDLNDSITGMGGHPQARTPNLERLMKMGVRFTRAYTNDPLCGPSRASFLTGLYPHTSGFYSNKNNWHRMRRCPKLKNAVTFMEHFWANGYDVYGTGKIYHNMDHEDRVWKTQKGKPTFGEPMDWGPWPWDGKHRPGFRGPVHPSLPETMVVDNSFASLDDVPVIPPDPERGIPGHKGWVLHGKPFRYVNEDDRDLMPDEKNARYAVETIQARHENPYLLCVGFNRPHTPLVAPRKYFDMFPLDEIRLPAMKKDDLEDCARILVENPRIATGRHGFDNYRRVIEGGGKALLKRWIQAYLACIAFVDDQVGKILDAWEKSPDKDRTYIVFTSDHGYHMGQKETLYKMTLWEEAGRIPFIFAGPGIARGKTCDRPVSLIDLYPTMVDLCGLPPRPNEKTNGLPLDGHSLRPLLEDPERGVWEGPPAALTVVANDDRHPGPGEIAPRFHHYAVRSRRYRYILCNDGEEELYDHDKDPHEWTNLAADPDYTAVKKRLRRTLLALTGQKKDLYPTPPAGKFHRPAERKKGKGRR